MTSFISDVLNHLHKKGVDFSGLTFILPNKRAGTFLKNELSKLVEKSIFSPQILSTEAFVEELSQLKSLTNTELLFEFYTVYQSHTAESEIESFDDFLNWAQILLQDFNEIDRFLIEPDYIFNYLNAIKDLNHWSVSSDQTPMIKKYLMFWENLQLYYSELRDRLINKGFGYQGLIYKEAVENLENYIQANPGKQHVFIGFNALNTSESRIIQELLQSELAEIYWDTDVHFITNPKHEAGHLIRSYLQSWRYLKTHGIQWTFDYYLTEKNVQIIGTPKRVGQAKYIGEILSNLNLSEQAMRQTAIVLGDENLLMPVLNSIPKSIKKINVTMGFPLRNVPLSSLFENLFLLHRAGNQSYYYKDVIAILSHQFIMPMFSHNGQNSAEEIITEVQLYNMTYLTENDLSQLCKSNKALIHLLFKSWGGDPGFGLEVCQKLILSIKEYLDITKRDKLLALEYLYKFNEIFNVLVALNIKYAHIKSIKVLFNLYKQILQIETVDFKGEPLEGLQIMGMLESRVLDFETVIISSVNEGILPAGKSHNSFIPFDVKLEAKLPTYKEKDAVYTYHFYRLLHRAQNIFILYDTETDGLNSGEKSRLITQLEIEKVHKLNSYVVAPNVPKVPLEPRRIKKTNGVIKRIELWAKDGISPSALLNYIRNPIDFYTQKVLGIKEIKEVEEVVGTHTLGTIIHETLRELYKPLENEILTVDTITTMIPKVNAVIEQQFKEHYKKGDRHKGKNLIVFEIAKRYVLNFLELERQSISNGDFIKLIAIESEVETTIAIDGVPFPVKLKGEIDRLDNCNGMLRIIDYKSGQVMQNQVEIINWEDLTTDYKKYGKSFQVLMYAFIQNNENRFEDPVEAGIISFKNLGAGLLKYSKKDRLGYGAKKDTLITQESFTAFSIELKKLILEIFDQETDFIEKDVKRFK